MTLPVLAQDKPQGNGPKPTDKPQGNGPSDSTQVTLFNPLKDETIPSLLSLILSTLTLLAIPVVAIMIVIGAYYIITSGGNPGRRATGKNYVLWAAVGFAILLLADSVVAILTDFISR